MPAPFYSTVPPVPPSPAPRPRSRHLPLIILCVSLLLSPLLLSHTFPAAVPSLRNYLAHLDNSPAVRCKLPPPSSDACSDFEIKGFYYDNATESCQKFIWRGCPGAVPFWYRGGCIKANCPDRDEYPRVSPTPTMTPSPTPSPAVQPRRVYFANWAEPAWRLTMFGTQKDVVGTYSGYVYTDQTWILYPTEKEGEMLLRNGRKIERVFTTSPDKALGTTTVEIGDEPSEYAKWIVQDPEDPQYPEGAVMLRSVPLRTYILKMTGKGIGGVALSDAYADSLHLWKIVECDLELNDADQVVCYP